MPNDANKLIVEKLREKIAKSKSVLFAQTQGVKANDVNNLRESLRQVDGDMSVAKNSLLGIALKEENIDTKDLELDLKGQTAAIFSYKDAIAPIKTFIEFAKKLEIPKVKSAYIEGTYTNSEGVEIISKLPPKEQLLAQFIGTLKAPLNSFASVLKGNQRKFLYALVEISKKKE